MRVPRGTGCALQKWRHSQRRGLWTRHSLGTELNSIIGGHATESMRKAGTENSELLQINELKFLSNKALCLITRVSLSACV